VAQQQQQLRLTPQKKTNKLESLFTPSPLQRFQQLTRERQRKTEFRARSKKKNNQKNQNQIE
jgi:hypothetical protein